MIGAGQLREILLRSQRFAAQQADDPEAGIVRMVGVYVELWSSYRYGEPVRSMTVTPVTEPGRSIH